MQVYRFAMYLRGQRQNSLLIATVYGRKNIATGLGNAVDGIRAGNLQADRTGNAMVVVLAGHPVVGSVSAAAFKL